MTRIAINGFGRIGRHVFRLAMANKISVVAINDVHGVKDAEYLLKYDTIYGRYPGKVEASGSDLKVDGKKIRVLNERDPTKLPWKKLKADIVIESTGVFREREGASQHLAAGAKKVIITAPAKRPDVTIVPGVNNHALKKEHNIISVASCTTNCLVPVVKVLDDNFKIKNALMTTIHAYTNDQIILDSSHKKFRRGRAAAQNMIPTTTGAAQAVVEVMPHLLGKITGLAVRVPVPVGSLVDLNAVMEKEFTVDQVNDAFKKAAHDRLKGILDYSEDELVSSDIIGDPHSSKVDGLSTQKDGDLLKVLAWYDNEFGYSNRVIDVIRML